jgi:hypothetical protein
MPSVITSIIGGIQGASAAHHAASELQKGYTQAGQTVTGAVQQVNPEILAAAKQAGIDLTGAAQTAGTGATTAAATAGTGATTAASKFADLLSPYMQGGNQAMGQLTAGIAPGGQFNQPFTAQMMGQYSPAYQFQLQQGQQAAQRAAAAQGLTGSGGTMKALNRYAQDYSNTAFGSAANLYNTQQTNAFNRLSTLASGGQQAAGLAGEAGQQAAEYAGTLGTQAAQYAGNLNTGATQWAGAQNIGATNLASSNTLSGASYLANTQMGAAGAQAQGDLGAAAQWNNMLGGIGAAGNSLLMAGMGGAPGTTSGWSFSNMGQNLWGQPGGGKRYGNFGTA